MTFLEKQSDPTSFMHWRGDMQADYLYTNGVAGNRFFAHLKKKDTFLASRCPQCKKVFMPPRMFCEDCFCDIPDKAWIEVPARGTVRVWTVATINAHGKKLKEPKVIALIDIDKTDSAMLGIIKTKNPDKDLFGQKVKAVLRPKKKREGTLKDILYFE
ncbi:MAG: Zn-ribbon domain-containing OB-fold protein [Thermoplasmata archaeon]|nr:MAG: Zn-ribbon domain-containing OB-fold protein [Thermoplasmata archaeon]